MKTGMIVLDSSIRISRQLANPGLVTDIPNFSDWCNEELYEIEQLNFNPVNVGSWENFKTNWMMVKHTKVWFKIFYNFQLTGKIWVWSKSHVLTKPGSGKGNIWLGQSHLVVTKPNSIHSRQRSVQGCISCGMCSYPELTKDHVLTSAYVNIFRTVTRNAVNKSVWRKKDCFWLPLNKHTMNIFIQISNSPRTRARFSENQSAPRLENRKTSPCSPCAPNLLHVLVSRILGYHNLCSPE